MQFKFDTLEQILVFVRQTVRHSNQKTFLFPDEFALVLAAPGTEILTVDRPIDSLAYRNDAGPYRADCRLNGYCFQTQYNSVRPDFRARAVGL